MKIGGMMNLYRYKKDKKLYILFLVSPRVHTGSWYEAVPYKHKGEYLRNVDINKFEKIFTSKKVFML